MKRNTLYGGLIVLECVLWGLGNPVIKIAGQLLQPFTAIFMRFCLAFLICLLLFGRRVLRSWRAIRWGPMLAVCVCTALAFTLGSFALLLTDAVIAGFLMGISVLFTPFLETVLLRKRFNARVLPLIAIVCVGMYLLCGGGAFSFGVGELLAVLCSLSFALMLTLSERYIGDMDPMVLSTMQCGVTAALSLICVLCFEGPISLSQMTGQAAGAILYLALGSTILAYLLQNTAMRHLPATFASLAFCTEPIFTALFSYILLGERLGPLNMAGAAIVLAIVVIASVRKEEEPWTPKN